MTTESTEPFVAPHGAEVLALDVDGVLVHPVLRSRRWDVGLQNDLGIDPADLGRNFFGRYWREVVVGRLDLRDTLSTYLSEAGSSVSVDELVSYWFEKDSAVDLDVVDVARQWQSECPNRFIVVVSNQERYRVDYLTRTLGLRDVLDGALWSCQLGVIKSDPTFYQLANRENLSEARWVIFFDDEEKHVSLANAAGWEAHLFVDISELVQRLSAPAKC